MKEQSVRTETLTYIHQQYIYTQTFIYIYKYYSLFYIQEHTYTQAKTTTTKKNNPSIFISFYIITYTIPFFFLFIVSFYSLYYRFINIQIPSHSFTTPPLIYALFFFFVS